jgi:signal transduction histidine kinase
VREAKQLAGEALRDVRRSVGTLRATPPAAPVALDAALTTLVENMRASPVTIQLQITGASPTRAPAAQQALYRVAQESLTNVQKHAGATTVAVRLVFSATATCLEVADNGRGFDPTASADEGPGAGYGLRGLRERLAEVGGQLAIRSAPGAGTTVRACVPTPEAGAHDQGRRVPADPGGAHE